jgi:hypothetical protein
MSSSARILPVKYCETISRLQSSHIWFDTLPFAMETGTPAVPVKLTKSGEPRRPYVMTEAKKEAFEKCRQARLGKLQAPPATSEDTATQDRVQLAKEQAQCMDQAMGQPPAEPKAAPVRKKRVRLKEPRIPLRKNTG